jgi:hypothetical protein
MRSVALLFAALLPLAAHADTLGFKGTQLGSPLARIASDPRHECHAVKTPLGDTICGLRPLAVETIAGAPVVSLFYFYDTGSLTSIQITVSEKDFARAVDALVVKYGAGKLRSEKVKNFNGAEFENHDYLWTRPEGSLQAQRYAGSVDKSLIRYTDNRATVRIQQRRASIAKDPRLDL